MSGKPTMRGPERLIAYTCSADIPDVVLFLANGDLHGIEPSHMLLVMNSTEWFSLRIYPDMSGYHHRRLLQNADQYTNAFVIPIILFFMHVISFPQKNLLQLCNQTCSSHTKPSISHSREGSSELSERTDWPMI